MFKYIPLSLALFFLCPLSYSQDKKVFSFFKSQKTFINNPFDLRDPFKRPSFKIKKTTKNKFGGLLSGNSFTNLPNIEGLKLADIKIVGIVLGKNRRAVANAAGKTFILVEGMSIGENNAELKAILPGGVVLVEKFKNVYDQDEYLETIIPVTSD